MKLGSISPCRHCGKTLRLRSRGLCTTCYLDPSVRDLYPVAPRVVASLAGAIPPGARTRFEAHRGLAYSLAHQHSSGEWATDGDDICQEALIGLWKASVAFAREPRQEWLPYARASVNNEIRSYKSRRRSSRLPGFAAGEAESATCQDQAPGDAVEAAEEAAALLAKMRDKRLRAVAWLSFAEDLPPPEVARRIGMSVAWVAKAKAAILAHFRTCT